MKYSKDLVSIIIPVCNAASYLEESLDSLSRQTHKHIEIIAIDDASRDDSYAILKSYQKKDKRFSVYQNKKRYGLAITYNRAVKRAKGTYIAFMNAKDVSSLHRIKRQVTFLMKNPKIAGVGTQYKELDEKNRKQDKSSLPSDHDEIYQSLLATPTMHYETVMVNRLLLPKDGLKFTSDVYPHMFTELFMRLFQYGKFANINQYLYFLRIDVSPTAKQLSRKEYLLSYLRLWIKSIAVYDYRPSLRSLFSPFAKQF